MCRNRPLASRAGKAQSTPPKETSRQVSKRVDAPFKKPNAARTRSSGLVHAVPISAVASSTTRVDLSLAVDTCGTGASSGADSPGWSGKSLVSRPCWIALRSVPTLRPSCAATSLGLQPAPNNCCAWAATSGVITEAPRRARGAKNARTPPIRYLSTLRMALFFDTPKARTISTWRHTPWQISWAVNIRNERWSFSAC